MLVMYGGCTAVNIKIAETLLLQCHRNRKSKYYVMDKEYDSEKIYELTRNKLGSKAMMPLRQRERKMSKGSYRRKMKHAFDKELYHQRNLVETMFSVLKRKYGESLCARNYRNQIRSKVKSIDTQP